MGGLPLTVAEDEEDTVDGLICFYLLSPPYVVLRYVCIIYHLCILIVSVWFICRIFHFESTCNGLCNVSIYIIYFIYFCVITWTLLYLYFYQLMLVFDMLILLSKRDVMKMRVEKIISPIWTIYWQPLDKGLRW